MTPALLLIAELDGISGIARECWVSPFTLRRRLNRTRQRYFAAVVKVMRALRLDAGRGGVR